jgi:hypothetical protein
VIANIVSYLDSRTGVRIAIGCAGPATDRAIEQLCETARILAASGLAVNVTYYGELGTPILSHQKLVTQFLATHAKD